MSVLGAQAGLDAHLHGATEVMRVHFLGARIVCDDPGGGRAPNRRGVARTRGDGLGGGPPARDLRDPAPSAPQRLPEASAVRLDALLVDVVIAILAAIVVDVVIAILAAIVVLPVTPGLAVAALLAIAALRFRARQ
jgi:hypothetical protein